MKTEWNMSSSNNLIAHKTVATETISRLVDLPLALSRRDPTTGQPLSISRWHREEDYTDYDLAPYSTSTLIASSSLSSLPFALAIPLWNPN